MQQQGDAALNTWENVRIQRESRWQQGIDPSPCWLPITHSSCAPECIDQASMWRSHMHEDLHLLPGEWNNKICSCENVHEEYQSGSFRSFSSFLIRVDVFASNKPIPSDTVSPRGIMDGEEKKGTQARVLLFSSRCLENCQARSPQNLFMWRWAWALLILLWRGSWEKRWDKSLSVFILSCTTQQGLNYNLLNLIHSWSVSVRLFASFGSFLGLGLG